LLEKGAHQRAQPTARPSRPRPTRLLADPKARESTWRFFSEWLGFGEQIYDSRADRALAADFAEETKRFVNGVVFDTPAAPFKDLLDNDKTMVNARLSRHYGLPVMGTDTDWRQVTLDPGQKAGVLAKAQVAIAHSAAGDTSIVQRGRFVDERLLCFDLGVPPPGVQAMNPVLPPSATVRERMEARMKIASCGACHQYLDYAGIGMEDIDHLGRFRAKYPSGATVDAAGKLLALAGTDQEFTGTAALAHKLAASPDVAGCITRQWFRYVVGRHETDAESRCHVARMGKRFSESGYDLKQLLLSASSSDSFVYRTDPK
jgi:hypothetical protein